jgi:predicted alpha/beta hydrolase family esterase
MLRESVLLNCCVKAVILHGTNGSHRSNWLPWLQAQLEACGWEVWNPDLPEADQPNTLRYNEFFSSEAPFVIDAHTVMVGHSSGCLAALGWLEQLDDVAIAQLVLVSAFMNDLGWPALAGLFKTNYNWSKLRKKTRKTTLFHSDDDPYCPLEHAEFLARQLYGELRMLPGRGHFNIESDPPQTTFPELLQLLVDS